MRVALAFTEKGEVVLFSQEEEIKNRYRKKSFGWLFGVEPLFNHDSRANYGQLIRLASPLFYGYSMRSFPFPLSVAKGVPQSNREPINTDN